MKRVLCAVLTLPALLGAADHLSPIYSVLELTFTGPEQRITDSPARDVDLRVRFRHESGSPEYAVYGFWDGGNTWKVRLTPTKPGGWRLAEVTSNRTELRGQREGDTVTATPSKLHGFWIPDEASPGRRWFRRSDGTHQYIYGNTMYSLLNEMGWDGKPNGSSIEKDTRGNAEYFRKVRFSAIGDLYPNPNDAPFLDAGGKPTYSGEWSHRPNPAWFQKRTDVAVKTAFENDLVADLILAGVDTANARSALLAARNEGYPAPFLKYMAARYSAYPNVWICIVNEFNIKSPRWTPDQAVRLGETLRQFVVYPTPVSIHANSGPWEPALNTSPAWNTHVIIQKKIRNLTEAADALQSAFVAGGSNKPAIDDELSYEGAGDRHTEGDTIESHLGAFLGGGYGTTGHKTGGTSRQRSEDNTVRVVGEKTGQYFAGNFNPAEHTSADNLLWLRGIIDSRISFWRMQPDLSIFTGLDAEARGMAWPANEYVFGTNKAKAGISARLPAGKWDVVLYDVMLKRQQELGRGVAGTFTFDVPESRAVLIHLRKTGS